jgi:hypothetical protein
MSLDPSISFTAYWQRLCLQFEIPTLVAYALSITEYFTLQQQQQQQQHSLLSQASWGRLEMKPKRDEKQGDT